MLKFLTSSFRKIKRALFAEPPSEELFDKIEQTLVEADLGAALAHQITTSLRSFIKKNPEADLLQETKRQLLQILGTPQKARTTTAFHIVLIVGVNGSGKTTSMAKLAFHYQQEGKKVLLGACDTFRAAATEQLALWADRLGAPLVKGKMLSDPAAVAFDAISAAKARGYDLVILDTAGRLQNKQDLMKELEKVKRACGKAYPGAPHETLLILDATCGQNGLDQATLFHAAAPLTGIVLTKLDGTAKGGIALAITQKLNLPIQWIGVGEKEEDILAFDPKSYIDALFD